MVFRASFVFWDALGNGWLFRLGVKLLFWLFHYLILYLDVFWALVSLLLLLFLFVLFLLFLHELIYFYHVFLCDLVDLQWLFRLSHILKGLIFVPWLFLRCHDLLDSWICKGNDCFRWASHFFEFLGAFLSWTLFGRWIGAGSEFLFVFMVLSGDEVFFSLWYWSFAIVDSMFILLEMKGFLFVDFDVLHGFGLFFSG
jgi:hypothetical protein